MSPAYTQALNGDTERQLYLNRSAAAKYLATANLPDRFHNFAADYACEVLSNIVHTNMTKSPRELVYSTTPNLNRLHPFGVLVAVFVPKQLRKSRVTANHKAEPGLFLGYTSQRIALVYIFCTKTVREEFNVLFSSNIFPGLHLEPKHLHPLIHSNFECPYGTDCEIMGGHNHIDISTSNVSNEDSLLETDPETLFDQEYSTMINNEEEDGIQFEGQISVPYNGTDGKRY